jgi:hypothetical protein
MAVKLERRKHSRGIFAGRVQLARTPSDVLDANPVNVSDAGICLRIKELLEVSSRVQVRLFASAKQPPRTCDGRVAWVVQRLDLRSSPPFLYDVGVEFLKAAVAQTNGRLKWEPIVVAQRRYTPSIQRDLAGGDPWHLVVRVDGAPCFAKRFGMLRDAREAWEKFQRDVMRREARS